MKKIISSLLITLFCLNAFSIQNTFALESNYYTKQVILTKYELQKTNKWKSYSKQIDQIVDTISKKEWQIEKLQTKLEKIDKSNLYKNKELNNVINYLEAKVNYEITKNIDNEDYIVIEEKEEIVLEEISLEEKQNINKEVSKLHWLVYKNINSLLEIGIKEFEKYQKTIETTGDLNLNLKSDIYWTNINTSLSISDYETFTNQEDVKFNWNIDFNFESEINGQNMNYDFSTLLETVIKDNDFFIKLKDLQLSDESILSFYKPYYDLAKQYFDEDKFIKFPLNISSLNNKETIDKINTEAEKIKNESFLEVVWKISENKYKMNPTKSFCDYMKNLNGYFDPFNWNTCSDSQYKDMIDELNKNWYLYMISEKWKNPIFGFELLNNKDFKNFDLYITYSENNLEEVNIDIQSIYWDDKLKLSYIYDKKFDIELMSNKDWFSFNSEISNDKINKFNFTFTSNDKEIVKVDFENMTLIWNINIVKQSYNNNWEREDSSIFDANLNAKLDSKYKLEKADVDYTIKDIKSWVNTLEWNIKIWKYDFTWNTKINHINGWEIIDIKTNWLYSSNTFNVSNDIKINALIIEYYQKNSENIKVMSDVRNLTKTISIEMAKWNKLSSFVNNDNTINFEAIKENKENFINPIDWSEYKIFIKEGGSGINAYKFYQIYWLWYDSNNIDKEAIISWNYYKIDDSFPESIVNINWENIVNWDIVEKWTIDESDLYEANFDINYNWKSNKNDLEIIFDLMKKLSKDKMIDFELKNEGKLYETNGEIEAPENYVDFQDVINSNSSSDYYYY